MPITDENRIHAIVYGTEDARIEEGEEEFFFDAPMVKEIYLHKVGQGDGVYFRLHDGRIFNSYGDQCESDLSLYDTVEN